MPNSLLFKVIGGLVDSLTVVLDNLGWWMGVLGPDSNPAKFMAMEEVGCECGTCGATDIDTVADCALDPVERLLGTMAIFTISLPSSPNLP